jgi:hypothetical protein
MRRRGMLFAVLFACGSVWGQAPVGPSTAVLDGSRFGLTLEYGRTDADIAFHGGGKGSFDFQTAYANLSAALNDRWDFFLRLGGSQAEIAGFDGGWNVSWGMGTRVTAFEWHAWRWGVLAQFTNLVSRTDALELFLVEDTLTLLPATDELNLVEYILATGPTWRQDRVSLYGGLLVRFLDGEYEVFTHHFGDQLDVDAQWEVGGYLGGVVTLFQTDPSRTYGFNRCDLTAEGRFTNDSTGFSIGVLLPFGGGY